LPRCCWVVGDVGRIIREDGQFVVQFLAPWLKGGRISGWAVRAASERPPAMSVRGAERTHSCVKMVNEGLKRVGCLTTQPSAPTRCPRWRHPNGRSMEAKGERWIDSGQASDLWETERLPACPFNRREGRTNGVCGGRVNGALRVGGLPDL